MSAIVEIPCELKSKIAKINPDATGISDNILFTEKEIEAVSKAKNAFSPHATKDPLSKIKRMYKDFIPANVSIGIEEDSNFDTATEGEYNIQKIW